ncbi:MAG: radical SAM protein [Acidobacteria bacterium]|nr:MAG: radical SAM protein [Acidobacteriota bacterium]
MGVRLPDFVTHSKVLSGAIGWLIASDTVRRPLRRWGERTLERQYLVENRWHRPRRLQQDRLAIVRAMFETLDRLLSRPDIARSCKKGLVRALVENTFLGGFGAIEDFRRRHGHRPPAFLTISPGQHCNLRCRGCYAASDASRRVKLEYELVERIIEDKERLWGSFFTVVSGGEPFLWHSDGRGLLELAAAHPDEYFLVYTNGTLIDEDLAERIARVGNVSPAISIEGLQKETDARRGPGTWRRIQRAFAALRTAGVPFGVSMTATRLNADKLLSDEVLEEVFERAGACYGWIFHYMPIGRDVSFDLMVTPAQRVAMFHRTWQIIRERRLFLVDFWNGGTGSLGCISGGRGGGYFYIDWNGNVCPCVFNPFAAASIREIYARGGDLNDALFAPFMTAIRQWQDDYALDRPPHEMGNLICQCAIRDHASVMHDLIEEHRPRPVDSEAAAALTDPGYWKRLERYGREVEALTAPIWESEYIGPERARAGIPASRETVAAGDAPNDREAAC